MELSCQQNHCGEEAIASPVQYSCHSLVWKIQILSSVKCAYIVFGKGRDSLPLWLGKKLFK